MAFRRVLIMATCAVALAACGTSSAATVEPTAATIGGVGVLPETVGASPALAATTDDARTSGSVEPVGSEDTSGSSDAAAASSSSTVAVETTLPPEGPVGSRAPGNRVLMIGDSVLASTSRRYSNDMCQALVPLGWKVELDAEVGRFIDFGKRVLDARLGAGWDASVILLGNNYGKNPSVFSAALEQLVVRLSPNPIVLTTVTEFDPSRKEVNYIIELLAAKYPNVTILDWATASEAPGLLGGDGLHLTPSGRYALALNMAATLGPAPASPGECLPTGYRNDSAGSVDGGPPTTRRPGSGSNTTVRSTGTTVRSTGTTVRSTGTTARPAATTAPPAGTTKPTTAPLVTTPPATAAPVVTAAPTPTPAPTQPAPTQPAPTPATQASPPGP